ncbi:hypothetical protein GJV06_00130 [Enterobacteriaceae bacterium RIT691]|nr:hypothetical protein [Enterobacteriaceae bacterium RIT691]
MSALWWFTEFGHLNRGDKLTSEQHSVLSEGQNLEYILASHAWTMAAGHISHYICSFLKQVSARILINYYTVLILLNNSQLVAPY